ncbi:hypothetical protein J6590_046729 [Homalodisca vitripennis]|nr:hypothetical protein J6590_046729 [Homalodisca vitripennis]
MYQTADSWLGEEQMSPVSCVVARRLKDWTGGMYFPLPTPHRPQVRRALELASGQCHNISNATIEPVVVVPWLLLDRSKCRILVETIGTAFATRYPQGTCNIAQLRC